MAFVFLHSADWQLGKPFGSFDLEKQAVLRRARLEAIDRLALAAGTAGASHVLVAGDIFDAEGIADSAMNEALNRLAAQRDIHWHLLPGNHDPARAGGLWDRIAAARPSANIHLHVEPVAFEAAPNVFILPAPLKSKSVSRDPSAWMDDAATPAGAIRIGLAHGSVHGFDGDGEAAVDISPSRDRTAGLAYLALGDWHGMTRISDRVWYSGTPEPDRFKDNSPGHALVVRIEDAKAPPRVEAVATAAHLWERREITMASAADIDGLEAEIEAMDASRNDRLLQLVLTGVVTLADHAEIEDRLQRLEAKLFYLERRLAGLHVLPDDADLAMIGDAGLRTAAQALQVIAADTADPRAATAERALRRLFLLSLQEGGGDVGKNPEGEAA